MVNPIECKNSKEMWARLQTVHQENQLKINIHHFFEELYTRKYKDGSSMADHIAAMLDLKYQITQAGEDLPDIHVAWAMILLLPKTRVRHGYGKTRGDSKTGIAGSIQ
jgi:hypothetical protein